MKQCFTPTLLTKVWLIKDSALISEKVLLNLIKRCLSIPSDSRKRCLSLKLLNLAFVLPKKDSGVTEKEITREGMPLFFAVETSFFSIS